MQYNREPKTIANSSTIAAWVDAYNNNALTLSDVQYMIGEATFSSVLYTGLETVGNGINSYKMDAFKDVAEDFKAVYPDNLILDNWYVYFRNINKFILVSNLHVDLTDYSNYDNNEFIDGDLYHFFLNYQLGFRISHSPIPKEGEARLFRFIARNNIFEQLIATFPRYFYSGSNVDYIDITGMDVKPVISSGVSNTLGVASGFADYDGISHDFHAVPDRKYYNDSYINSFTIQSGGAGYRVNDIVGTNEAGINLKVTAVDNSYTLDDAWKPDVRYAVGWRVYYNLRWWRCLIENIGITPDLAAPEWSNEGLAGIILDGEISTDPVDIQIGATGAKIFVEEIVKPWKLLYNDENNKIDYARVTDIVDGSMIMDYTNNNMESLSPGKFTIQRIHLDYLKDILVIQYGNVEFDSMKEALNAVYSLSFPFVYNTYIFPVLAYMIVRSDYTDLSDNQQCQIVQVHTSSADIRESENLATDSYARAILAEHARQIAAINEWLTKLQAQTDQLELEFDLHISNNLPSPEGILKGSNPNPHRVNKAQVGLGNVDNVALKDMWVPTTNEVNNGNATGLVHVREAIDEAIRICKDFTTANVNRLGKDAQLMFLRKDVNDHTNPGVVTGIGGYLKTNAKYMVFKSDRTQDCTYTGDTPTNSRSTGDGGDRDGYAWFVGDLPSTTRESFGVKKS